MSVSFYFKQWHVIFPRGLQPKCVQRIRVVSLVAALALPQCPFENLSKRTENSVGGAFRSVLSFTASGGIIRGIFNSGSNGILQTTIGLYGQGVKTRVNWSSCSFVGFCDVSIGRFRCGSKKIAITC